MPHGETSSLSLGINQCVGFAKET